MSRSTRPNSTAVLTAVPPALRTAVLTGLLTVLAAGLVPAPAAAAMPAPDLRDRRSAEVDRPTFAARADTSSGRPRGTWPLQPRPPVASHFDPPEHRWESGHRGVDLGGRAGQQVRAALAGRVSFAGRVAGTPVVVVDHGGTRTTYQPVTATVSRGEEVTAGQAIGRLGWPGTHCSPAACLHWGWIRGDTYLDPLLLVGAAPRRVRLLPL